MPLTPEERAELDDLVDVDVLTPPQAARLQQLQERALPPKERIALERRRARVGGWRRRLA